MPTPGSPAEGPGPAPMDGCMERFVDIYGTSDLWALPLVEDYLAQFGIETLVRTNAVSVYPMAIGPLSGFRVGVRADKTKIAARLLEQALCDRVFPGELLTTGREGEEGRSRGP